MMERLIRESRRQPGGEFLWFVAQVSYHSPADPSAPEIREAQASARVSVSGPCIARPFCQSNPAERS